MKKTLLVMAMAIALALSTMAGALATNGNAPGHAEATGTLQGEATDDDYDQEVRYLFNKAGYHFWFTATDPGWAQTATYTEGHDYHNIYKYQVDDPENWCFLPGQDEEGREPYNIGGTLDLDKYYKIWDVTAEEWVCGSES